MAQQTINLGTSANDGTGDTLRDGGDKINDNFTELYASVAAAGTNVTTQTGTTYTFALSDAETVVQLSNASSITATVPPNSTTAFPIGTLIEIHQSGAGVVTVAPGSGVTINSRGSLLSTAGQHAIAGLRKVATDAWRFTGDIA